MCHQSPPHLLMGVFVLHQLQRRVMLPNMIWVMMMTIMMLIWVYTTSMMLLCCCDVLNAGLSRMLSKQAVNSLVAEMMMMMWRGGVQQCPFVLLCTF